jgi:hypothetical protein
VGEDIEEWGKLGGNILLDLNAEIGSTVHYAFKNAEI